MEAGRCPSCHELYEDWETPEGEAVIPPPKVPTTFTCISCATVTEFEKDATGSDGRWKPGQRPVLIPASPTPDG